jgi:hypothetical protein
VLALACLTRLDVAVAAVVSPPGAPNTLVAVNTRTGGIRWEVPTGHSPAGSLSALSVGSPSLGATGGVV